MKNMKKLVALFAATVMTMSLSVSAFAATVAPDEANDIDAGTFNLVFTAESADANIDQMTMIAYLMPADTTMETWVDYNGTQTIVALNQVGGSEGFGEVPVDTAKLLAEDAAIAVAVGGTDVAAADVYKALITYVEEDSSIYVTFMNGEEIVDTIAIVDGKAVLPETAPTLAASADYATTAYTFVEWVDADGNAVTADTAIDAATTVYAKFKSNYTTGDANGDGYVRVNDRTLIHNFITSTSTPKVNADKVQVPISEYLEKATTGDANGDGYVRVNDRTLIHNFITSTSTPKVNADKVQVAIYVVNK